VWCADQGIDVQGGWAGRLRCAPLIAVMETAELSPRTFCTFGRELSSPRDRLTSADAAMSSRC